MILRNNFYRNMVNIFEMALIHEIPTNQTKKQLAIHEHCPPSYLHEPELFPNKCWDNNQSVYGWYKFICKLL